MGNLSPEKRLTVRGNFKWLGDIIHSPHLKPLGLVFNFSEGSKEDDGHFGVALIALQSPAGFIPVHLGHHDVQQDQIRRVFLHGFKGRPWPSMATDTS